VGALLHSEMLSLLHCLMLSIHIVCSFPLSPSHPLTPYPQDPDYLRRVAETEAKLAEISAAKEALEERERQAQHDLHAATMALSEGQLLEKRLREECDEAAAVLRKTEERSEECKRRSMQMVADKEAAEARLQKHKDALVTAQHDEKMIEKREMQTRHDEQKVRECYEPVAGEIPRGRGPYL
jgi:chromosome segregation ATPase